MDFFEESIIFTVTVNQRKMREIIIFRQQRTIVFGFMSINNNASPLKGTLFNVNHINDKIEILFLRLIFPLLIQRFNFDLCLGSPK